MIFLRKFQAISIYGQTLTIAANVGDVAILEFNACFPDSVVGFYPFDSTDSDYLYYLLFAMKHEMLKTAVLSTQLNLNIERVSTIHVSIPPIEEQNRIAERLDALTGKHREIESHILDGVNCLKEYRTALISAAVTGQIDVRDEVQLGD